MSKKILIIDDEKDFIKLLKLNLEAKGGYEVLALLNANDIIPQVHQFKPDIIECGVHQIGQSQSIT